MISAWSFSRLDIFESCPYRAYLSYVVRIPEPERTPPPGKDEHPLDRGIRIHGLAEKYVIGKIELVEELQHFEADFSLFRDRFNESPRHSCVEQEWAFDDSWQRTSWFSDSTWGRVKLDYAFIDGKRMEVVDYKTGKKYPPKHIQQGQLYALTAALFYPKVEDFNVRMLYLDSGEELSQDYSRLQTMVFKDDFDRRARIMTEAKEFPPKPSAWTCRFCPYGENGNKYCEYRYKN